jgi:hypothetical protein
MPTTDDETGEGNFKTVDVEDLIDIKAITPPPIEWCLMDENEKPVANFIPEVMAEVTVHTIHGDETRISLRLHFVNGKPSNAFTIMLSDIENIKWLLLDRRCLIHSPQRHSKEFITNTIIAGLGNEPKKSEVYLLDRMGIHNINGNIVFVAGDQVIARSPEVAAKTEIAPIGFRLDIDPNLTPKEAFLGMRELISLSPEMGRPLTAHAVSAIMRSAFIAAGVTPSAILEIVGPSGFFKTAYTPTITQLYNRADEVKITTRLNTTDRSIEEILYAYSECTAVLDDRCTAESSKIRRKNDDTSEEIMRRIGDNIGRGRMDGKKMVQIKPRGNVVITGEYAAGIKSTVARGLMVTVTTPIDGRRLDKYQRQQPLLVSTFYYFMIQWYVDNYESICSEISQRLTRFRETTPEIHARLRQTQFCLQTAYMMFLQFCQDSGFITKETAVAEYNSFGSQLVDLVRAQNSRINPEEGNRDQVSYLKLIRSLYKGKSFKIAESVEGFDAGKHDGLLHYDCLCLRRERLEKRIRKIIREANINDIVKTLRAQGALKLGQDKNVVKIYGLPSFWFYAIRLDRLD